MRVLLLRPPVKHTVESEIPAAVEEETPEPVVAAGAEARASDEPEEPAAEQHGMARVRDLLSGFRLEQYADAFDAAGYDDYDYLLDLGRGHTAGSLHAHDKAALQTVTQDVGMKPAHAQKFVAYLSERAA